MEVLRLLRGLAPVLALLAVAGGLWLPALSGLAHRLPLSLAGQQAVEAIANLLFVIVAVVVVSAINERRMARLRQSVGALEGRLATREEALHAEVALRAEREELHHACEHRLRDFSEMGSDILWETGPQLTFTEVPARLAEWAGLPAERLLGVGLSELIEDPGRRLFTRMVPERATVRDMPVLVRSAGGVRQVMLNCRPYYTPTGLYGGYRGVLRDITTAQTERQAADLVAQRLEAALSVVGDGVVAADNAGIIVFANAKAAESLDWDVKQLVGRSLAATLQGGSRALAEDLGTRQRASRCGEIFLRRDGTEVPVDYVCVPLRHGDRDAGAVVSFHCVTERLRTERELLSAKERAEAATQAKSDFLAKMSHELRTPLNAIVGFSDIMLGELFGPIGNARYREYIQDIRQSSDHLQAILDDVLDLSRIESGHMVLQEQPTDLSVIVEDVLTMTRTSAARGGVSLSNNVPGNLPAVRADGRRLRQVLINLVSNAVRFTPEGGRVDVSAQPTGDGALVLRVQDTGVGIPPDELPKVTEVFVQGNLAIARKHGGAGLGLPLAKHLVELHGGRLTIESVVQGGTTVTVWLPPSRLVTDDDMAMTKTAEAVE